MQDDKTPKIKRNKGKDKIKDRIAKMGKYSSKHIRNKINKYTSNNNNLTENKDFI